MAALSVLRLHASVEPTETMKITQRPLSRLSSQQPLGGLAVEPAGPCHMLHVLTKALQLHRQQGFYKRLSHGQMLVSIQVVEQKAETGAGQMLMCSQPYVNLVDSMQNAEGIQCALNTQARKGAELNLKRASQWSALPKAILPKAPTP